ncbi:MAG: alpha/beta fold hydrolase [Actinomycetota bacterium]
MLLVHGSHLCDAFLPLIHQPALTSGYRLIHYHRRGFAASTHPKEKVSIARQAADAAQLLDRLGMSGPVHVVGHSYGGVIALQLALDTPELVHSLALLEPTRPLPPGAQATFKRQVARTIRLYTPGDKAGAVKAFLRAFGGSDWQRIIESRIPHGVKSAVRDADTFFQIELPALREWEFGPEEAATITQPALSVLGTESQGFFREGRKLLHSWLPHVEDFDLQGATHFLQIQDPEGIAKGLVAFLFRYPIPSPDPDPGIPWPQARHTVGTGCRSVLGSGSLLKRNLRAWRP